MSLTEASWSVSRETAGYHLVDAGAVVGGVTAEGNVQLLKKLVHALHVSDENGKIKLTGQKGLRAAGNRVH